MTRCPWAKTRKAKAISAAAEHTLMNSCVLWKHNGCLKGFLPSHSTQRKVTTLDWKQVGVREKILCVSAIHVKVYIRVPAGHFMGFFFNDWGGAPCI